MKTENIKRIMDTHDFCNNGGLAGMRLREAADEELAALEANETRIRQEVKWFAEQMERKLALNDDRCGWGPACTDAEFLVSRLSEEVNELENIYFEEGIDTEHERCQQIIDEAADVANFAMMLADRARKNMLSKEAPCQSEK